MKFGGVIPTAVRQHLFVKVESIGAAQILSDAFRVRTKFHRGPCLLEETLMIGETLNQTNHPRRRPSE